MYRYWVATALVIFWANGTHATGWQRQTYGSASAYCYPAYVYSYPATYVYPAVMPLASMPLASLLEHLLKTGCAGLAMMSVRGDQCPQFGNPRVFR